MNNPTIDQLKEKKLLFALLLSFITIGATWEFFRDKKIQEKGVYTIATVIDKEILNRKPYAFLKYTYRNQIFEQRVRSKYSRYKIGEKFWVQFLPTDPNGAILFFEENQIPECFFEIEISDEGWKEIPTCSKIEPLK